MHPAWLTIVAALIVLSLMIGAAPTVGRMEPAGLDGDRAAVARVLDELHDAAAKADGERYFALFSARGVFLGTDATERWTVEAFRAYAAPHFAAGRGWTYIPRADARNIDIAGDVAWFDELLDNAKYGECRGTGVLVREDDAWRIAQYHLTVPVPNELMEEVVGMIRGK